jgi:uncharacterized protein (DUF1800 family)
MSAPAAAIAANRFGLGARPGDLERIGADAKGWLGTQISLADNDATHHLTGLGSVEENLLTFFSATQEQRAAGHNTPPESATESAMADNAGEEGKDFTRRVGEKIRPIYSREILARTNLALATDYGFRERLVRFWSNHFTVSGQKPVIFVVAGNHEREAIRPRISGKFGELLLAATLHPAMLLYLDNALSFGPRSAFGKRSNRGLNENLAREILELHTVGVNGGYTQDDVIELARALTGWTTLRQGRGQGPERLAGKTHFIPQLHEPGSRKVMGRTYAEDGAEQAVHILRDLAGHPATAHHLALKLTRYFVSDTPPPQLVERLAQSYLGSGGALPALYRTLIESPEAWEPELRKFKQPEEFALSALRAMGLKQLDRPQAAMSFAVMGQQTFGAPSPAGWPDDAASWAGSDAVKRRLQWTSQLAERMSASGPAPVQIAQAVLGPFLHADTRQHIASAASKSEGLTLLLMSPEFQRR